MHIYTAAELIFTCICIYLETLGKQLTAVTVPTAVRRTVRRWLARGRFAECLLCSTRERVCSPSAPSLTLGKPPFCRVPRVCRVFFGKRMPSARLITLGRYPGTRQIVNLHRAPFFYTALGLHWSWLYKRIPCISNPAYCLLSERKNENMSRSARSNPATPSLT